MGKQQIEGTGIAVRVAEGSYMNPLCIEPGDARDESLAITVYEVGGAIVGVVITEGLDGEVGKPVVEYGLVPGRETYEPEHARP
jgi:hypothetical protein